MVNAHVTLFGFFCRLNTALLPLKISMSQVLLRIDNRNTSNIRHFCSLSCNAKYSRLLHTHSFRHIILAHGFIVIVENIVLLAV